MVHILGETNQRIRCDYDAKVAWIPLYIYVLSSAQYLQSIPNDLYGSSLYDDF